MSKEPTSKPSGGVDLKQALSLQSSVWARDALSRLEQWEQDYRRLRDENDRQHSELETLRRMHANESDCFRMLSVALTDGNAGSWEEVLHAVGTLRASVRELERKNETLEHKMHTKYWDRVREDNGRLTSELTKLREELQQVVSALPGLPNGRTVVEYARAVAEENRKLDSALEWANSARISTEQQRDKLAGLLREIIDGSADQDYDGWLEHVEKCRAALAELDKGSESCGG